MFVTDTENAFSTNSELLQDVSQFNIQCRNMIISMNDKYNSEQLYSFYSQLLEEINCYKAYDVWAH
jgi:hypothetical protein